MKSFGENFGIALCGLITSILVAIADVAIARMTTIDLFRFSIWFVVPAGAICIGLAAASGYYLGSLYFHKRATPILLVQMVAIAALTQLLIYYLGYATMVLDDGVRVSDLVPFSKYIDVLLTSPHYRIGRAQTDTGAVGNLGYWIALLQFLGFALGGLAVYGFLEAKVVCPYCDYSLRSLAKRARMFSNDDATAAYYDRVFTLPVDGPEFADLVRTEAKVKDPQQGAHNVVFTLMGCPKCKVQMVDLKVQNYTGKKWQDNHQLARRKAIPEGVDLVPIFRV